VQIAPASSGRPVQRAFFLPSPVSQGFSGVEIIRLSEKMNGLPIRTDESVWSQVIERLKGSAWRKL
jgi:hypothetical protein